MKKIWVILILLPSLWVFGDEHKPISENTKIELSGQSDRWIAKDKLKHFTASALIAGAGHYWMRHKQHNSDMESNLAGFGISLTFGIGKELLDVKNQRPFSIKDMIADILGIFFGLWILTW